MKKIDFSNYDIKLVCYEESAKENEASAFRSAIMNLKPNDRIAIVVGPEGGISPDEVEYLEKQGFTKVGLGPRILRTETAAITSLSMLMLYAEINL